MFPEIFGESMLVQALEMDLMTKDRWQWHRHSALQLFLSSTAVSQLKNHEQSVQQQQIQCDANQIYYIITEV